jgi:hypothetical protein
MSIENPFGPGRHTEKQKGVSEDDIRKRAEYIFGSEICRLVNMSKPKGI